LNKIYYFSSTGNSLWSAKKIASGIGGESQLYNIGVEAEKEEVTIEADVVIFVFPSYAYGLPLIVSRFVKKAKIKAPYIAAFVTYGTLPGGTLAEMSRILKKKNISSVYFGKIPSVENYIAMFGEQKEETITRRIAMQETATEEAVRVVVERKTNSINTFRPFSSFVSRLFSLGAKLFYRRYRVSTDCNGCSICEKVCSVSAVSMINGRPVFSSKCEHCQGCINLCPSRAIHFGRVNSKMPVYHHPSINISELYKKKEGFLGSLANNLIVDEFLHTNLIGGNE